MRRSPLDALAPRVAVVALGGALGAVGRWAATQTWTDPPTDFPWTTFAINVSGSLLLALMPALVLRAAARASALRRELITLALGPGVLGGWTTFSAFSEQARALLDAGRPGVAGAYLAGTLAACLLAVALGAAAGAALTARRAEP